jgi:hypothetical protein
LCLNGKQDEMKTLIQTALLILLSIGLVLEIHFDGGEIYERYEAFITSKASGSTTREAKNEVSNTVQVFTAARSSDRHHQLVFTPKTPHTYLIYKRNCCFLN